MPLTTMHGVYIIAWRTYYCTQHKPPNVKAKRCYDYFNLLYYVVFHQGTWLLDIYFKDACSALLAPVATSNITNNSKEGVQHTHIFFNVIINIRMTDAYFARCACMY